MSIFLDTLKQLGCDADGAMERLLGSESLLNTCVYKVLTDASFEKLTDALLAGDNQTAFDCAHTLKGISGNVGLTPLYTVACTVSEKLRHGNTDGIEVDCRLLIGKRDELYAALQELLEK